MWAWNLALAKVPEVAHILSFYAYWVYIELIFPVQAVVFEIRADFRNCHIWAWNLAIGKIFRSCIYPLFFPHMGSKLTLFSLYGQRFLRYGPIFKIPIFGHHTWPLRTDPKVAILSFCPKLVEIELILSLQAAVSEIRDIFQNCHIWAWRSCTYNLFKPEWGRNWAYFRSTCSNFRYFQNCHIWAWNLAIGQNARSCTYTLFQPQGVGIELIFALCAAVSEIWADFQNCHIWARNLAIG